MTGRQDGTPRVGYRLRLWWHSNRFAAAYNNGCWRCLVNPYHGEVK